MKVSVQDNPLKAGEKRIVLHTGQRLSYADFLAHAASSSTLTSSDVLAAFNCAAEWIKSAVASGREADLGPLGRSRLGMKGKLEGLTDRVEDCDVKMTINWILPPELKQFAAIAGADIVRKKILPKDKSPVPAEATRILAGGKLDPVPNRYAPGKPLRIDGWQLNYDAAQSDEGVFLIAEDGTERQVEEVVSVRPKQIFCMMADDMAGVYRLQVRRRHKPVTGKLLKGNLRHPLEQV